MDDRKARGPANPRSKSRTIQCDSQGFPGRRARETPGNRVARLRLRCEFSGSLDLMCGSEGGWALQRLTPRRNVVDNMFRKGIVFGLVGVFLRAYRTSLDNPRARLLHIYRS